MDRDPQVTATGRLLKPRPGTAHIHKVIAVCPDGTVRTLVSRQLKPNT